MKRTVLAATQGRQRKGKDTPCSDYVPSKPLWLCPVEDRRGIDSKREGMLEGLSLGGYLLLVDYSGRLFRTGKAVISAELANIFDRLGSTADSWRSRLEKLSQGRLLGRYFAAKRERLREVARDLGVHHLANLGRSAAR